MHWNVPPDALPGSATFVRVLDRWLNDCIKQPCQVFCVHYIMNIHHSHLKLWTINVYWIWYCIAGCSVAIHLIE